MRKIVFLIVIFSFFFGCSENNPQETPVFFGKPTAMISHPSSDLIFVADSEKRKIYSFDLQKLAFVNVAGDENYIPFVKGLTFNSAAFNGRELLVGYDDSETSVCWLYKIEGYPFESSVPVEKTLKCGKKVFNLKGNWGFWEKNKILLYNEGLTQVVKDYDLPVTETWKEISVGDNYLLLFPMDQLGFYAVDVTTGSVKFVKTSFLPSSGVELDGMFYVIGGDTVAKFDSNGEEKGERTLQIFWELITSGEGSVLGEDEEDHLTLVSGKGGVYFLDENLCFISKFKPGVKDQFFFDSGDPSNPTLTIGNFSNCVGDVPADELTIEFGKRVGGIGYIESVTSSSCFQVKGVDLNGASLQSGDFVVVQGNNYFSHYTLSSWGKNHICVKEKVDKTLVGKSVIVEINGYAIYSANDGYLGRMPRDGEFNLGYAKIKISEGTKPVTVGDYFIVSLSSGLSPLYFTTSSSYNVLNFLPKGIYEYKNRVAVLYSSEPLLGVLSTESGEPLTEVR